jgi:hypothetical protein
VPSLSAFFFENMPGACVSLRGLHFQLSLPWGVFKISWALRLSDRASIILLSSSSMNGGVLE